MAFARAIVIQSGCILFDEPLSALDALLREEMRHELKDLVTQLNLTAVFVTHDQTEAMSMSDKIAVLNGGVVEQYDTPEQIYHHPATAFVARFVGKSNWISDTQLFRPEAMSLEPRRVISGITSPYRAYSTWATPTRSHWLPLTETGCSTVTGKRFLAKHFQHAI